MIMQPDQSYGSETPVSPTLGSQEGANQPFSYNSLLINNSNKKGHKHALMALGVVTIVVVLSIGARVLIKDSWPQLNNLNTVNTTSNDNDEDTNDELVYPYTHRLPSGLAVTDPEYDFLTNLKTTFYKPSVSVHSLIIAAEAVPDRNELMSYGLGTKSESMDGRISVSQFAIPQGFNPPTTCGPYYPDGSKAPVSLPCRQVVKKGAYTGYAYEGKSPSLDYVSANGKPTTKLTLYAKFPTTVVVIQGINVSADTLIGYIDAMKPMELKDFPVGSTIVVNQE